MEVIINNEYCIIQLLQKVDISIQYTVRRFVLQISLLLQFVISIKNYSINYCFWVEK